MKYIDLSRAFDTSVAGFNKSVAKEYVKDGWNANTLTFYSHAGTHMDAPIHFDVKNDTIDQYPIERFFAKRCWVVDVVVNVKSQLIKIADVLPQLSKFVAGDSILVRTGWSIKHGTLEYRNDLPRISKELAEWMVLQKVNILGVEAPSVADVNNLAEVDEIHKILLDTVIIVEGLVNVGKLKSNLIELIALPLKIAGGDGCPCRVVGIDKM